ncbi:response regulator [bacterium]|nr:response regulator [bacterium]
MAEQKQKNELILIVDDNPKNIQLIGALLDKRDFRVSIADSGEKALNIVSHESPDLILLDIMMPGLNGFDTCRQLKTNPETSQIPVIFLSALTDTVNKVEGFKLGAVDYVTKPVEPEELLARVNTHLTIRALRKKLEEANSVLEEKVDIRTKILLEKNLALQESETRYRTLVDNIPGAVYRCAFDTDWTFIFISNAIEEISGYPASDFIGNSVRDYASIVHLEDKTMVEQAVLNAVSYNQPYLIDYRIIHADSSVRWVHEKGLGIFDDEGNVLYLEGVIYDNTQFKLIQENLKQAQKMEIVGTLASGLAHDFNNMLGGITGSISILEHKLQKDGKIEEDVLTRHMETMREGAHRAADMAKQMLSLSSKRELRIAPVDLNLAIKHVLKICANTFDKSVAVYCNFYSEPATTNADTTQIEQVFLNLCINAYHAMTFMRKNDVQQGGKLSIAIELIKTDRHFIAYYPEAKNNVDYWRVSIMDEGIGMNKEILSKIFDPFFTTKEKSMGTGLGLSIVHTIVKNHNGFITTYSQPGIGTVFNVHLPTDKHKLKLEEVFPKKGFPRGEGLVLIVDDETLMRESAKMMLKECGYDSIIAEDGEAGVRIFRQRHKEIRLVLLDLVMPNKSGKDCFLEMKEIDPEVKVLLSSGFTQDERVESVMNLGIEGFLHKPYTLENLANSIQKIIKSGK